MTYFISKDGGVDIKPVSLNATNGEVDVMVNGWAVFTIQQDGTFYRAGGIEGEAAIKTDKKGRIVEAAKSTRG